MMFRETNPYESPKTEPTSERPLPSPVDQKVREYNRRAVVLLVIELLIGSSLLLSFEWGSLHGRGAVGILYRASGGFFWGGGVLSGLGLVRVIEGAVLWTRKGQCPWGLPLASVLFLAALGMLGFGLWLH